MFGISKFTDHTVLERIKQGDEKMLVYLYNKHYTMVKTFIMKNSGDENNVDDILQESVIVVWQNANKADFLLHSKLSTYIMAIAKNLWFKELKKRTRFTLVDETSHLNAGSEEMNHAFDQSIIANLVNEMDEVCRKLLSYFYFDGLNNTVIAEKLGFANTDTVKSKKYQCFKKLQTTVLKHYNREDLL